MFSLLSPLCLIIGRRLVQWVKPGNLLCAGSYFYLMVSVHPSICAVLYIVLCDHRTTEPTITHTPHSPSKKTPLLNSFPSLISGYATRSIPSHRLLLLQNGKEDYILWLVLGARRPSPPRLRPPAPRQGEGGLRGGQKNESGRVLKSSR